MRVVVKTPEVLDAPINVLLPLHLTPKPDIARFQVLLDLVEDVLVTEILETRVDRVPIQSYLERLPESQELALENLSERLPLDSLLLEQARLPQLQAIPEPVDHGLLVEPFRVKLQVVRAHGVQENHEPSDGLVVGVLGRRDRWRQVLEVLQDILQFVFQVFLLLRLDTRDGVPGLDPDLLNVPGLRLVLRAVCVSLLLVALGPALLQLRLGARIPRPELLRGVVDHALLQVPVSAATTELDLQNIFVPEDIPLIRLLLHRVLVHPQPEKLLLLGFVCPELLVALLLR